MDLRTGDEPGGLAGLQDIVAYAALGDQILVRRPSLKRHSLVAVFLAVVALSGCSAPEVPERVQPQTEQNPHTPPPVVTTPPATNDSVDVQRQREVWAAVVEEHRVEWIDALEASPNAESVDRMEFEDGALVLGVTSGWASEGRRADASWGIARDVRDLWTDAAWPEGVLREPVWHMDLVLTVDDLTYRCFGETMRQLAERRMERTDWEASCSG